MTTRWRAARGLRFLLAAIALIAPAGCGPGPEPAETPAPPPRETPVEPPAPADDSAARTDSPAPPPPEPETAESLPSQAPPPTEEELEEERRETRKRADEVAERLRESLEGMRRSHEDVPGRE